MWILHNILCFISRISSATVGGEQGINRDMFTPNSDTCWKPRFLTTSELQETMKRSDNYLARIPLEDS